MSTVKHLVRTGGTGFLFLAAALVFCERPASAYTDPGTGTLLWQMLAAGLVGGIFYLRKLTTWLRRKDHKE